MRIDRPWTSPASRRRTASRGAVVMAMALGGCAGVRPLPPGAYGCEGSTAPGRWMLQPGGVLQGVVAEMEGPPLVGAVVRIRPLGTDSVSGAREAQTATQGAFALDSMTPGRYVASAGAPGHGAWTGTVELVEGRGTTPRIQLCTRR